MTDTKIRLVEFAGVMSSIDPDKEDFRGFAILAADEETATRIVEAKYPEFFVIDIYPDYSDAS